MASEERDLRANTKATEVGDIDHFEAHIVWSPAWYLQLSYDFFYLSAYFAQILDILLTIFTLTSLTGTEVLDYRPDTRIIPVGEK